MWNEVNALVEKDFSDGQTDINHHSNDDVDKRVKTPSSISVSPELFEKI